MHRPRGRSPGAGTAPPPRTPSPASRAVGGRPGRAPGAGPERRARAGRTQQDADQDLSDQARMAERATHLPETARKREQDQHLKQEDQQVVLAELREWGHHVHGRTRGSAWGIGRESSAGDGPAPRVWSARPQRERKWGMTSFAKRSSEGVISSGFMPTGVPQPIRSVAGSVVLRYASSCSISCSGGCHASRARPARARKRREDPLEAGGSGPAAPRGGRQALRWLQGTGEGEVSAGASA